MLANDEQPTMREQIEGLIVELEAEITGEWGDIAWDSATDNAINRLRAILDSEN